MFLLGSDYACTSFSHRQEKVVDTLTSQCRGKVQRCAPVSTYSTTCIQVEARGIGHVHLVAGDTDDDSRLSVCQQILITT